MLPIKKKDYLTASSPEDFLNVYVAPAWHIHNSLFQEVNVYQHLNYTNRYYFRKLSRTRVNQGHLHFRYIPLVTCIPPTPQALSDCELKIFFFVKTYPFAKKGAIIWSSYQSRSKLILVFEFRLIQLAHS